MDGTESNYLRSLYEYSHLNPPGHDRDLPYHSSLAWPRSPAFLSLSRMYRDIPPKQGRISPFIFNYSGKMEA